MSRKSEKSSHDVWLAGLGALAVAEQEGSDLFKALVKKGKEFEQGLMANAGSTWRGMGASASELREVLRKSGPAYVLINFGSKDKSPALLDPDEATQRQARRMEVAQRQFLKEFGGSSPGFRRNWERWRRERKIFAVADQQATYIPSFQFDEKGRPRPVVARVIQLLGDTTSEWGLALWFAAANGWLDGKRPVDLLASAPEEVVEAAEREAEELVF